LLPLPQLNATPHHPGLALTPHRKPALHPPARQIPILADVTKAVAARYGVLKRDAGIALRGLYIINPEVRGRGALHAQLKHL
jgi:alkyl hydroperoxide reductase subunit AhpC